MTHRHQRIATLWVCIAFAVVGYGLMRAFALSMVGP